MTTSTERHPRTLITMTGPTATGKTTTARQLVQRFSQVGIKAIFLDDYLHMLEWARDPINVEQGLVAWQENTFIINNHAYLALSDYIACRLALDAAQFFREGYDIVIVEAARGAGMPMDRYAPELFIPFLRQFEQSFAMTQNPPLVFNVETSTPFQIALERAQRRAESDPTAPPPEILSRYMTIDGVKTSAHEEASQSELSIRSMLIDTSKADPEEVAGRIWREVMLDRVSLLEGPSPVSEIARRDGPARSKES